MNIGSLDRRILIEEPAVSTGTMSDEETTTWSTYKSDVPAKKDFQRVGIETVEGMQKIGFNPVRWYLRYDSGLNTTMRFFFDSKYYQLVSIQEDGRARGLIVITEQRDNE